MMKVNGMKGIANRRTANRILALVVMVAIVTICDLSPSEAFSQKKKVNALSYDLSLKLDTKNDRLSETVTIKVKNNTDKTISTLCLRDMTPAIHKFNRKNYSEGNEKKTSKITYVRLPKSKNNLKVRYKKDKSVLYVSLGKKGRIKPGKTGEVVVRMKTDIPYRNDRFGYMKTKKGKLYALSFCFPYLADNRNGKWQTDPFFDDGESRSWDLADYNVILKAPKSFKVAATGSSKTTKGRTVIKAKKVRDLAIVACDFMKKDSFKASGVKVNNYYLVGTKYSRNYRKLTKLVAQDSLKVFTERVGKAPYKELDVIPCLFGFGFGGMEYPGLVMVNASSFYSGSLPDPWSLTESLSHEVGHQWFYAAVGNREYKEGWIDEGFTTLLERDYYRLYDCPSYRFLREIDEFSPSIKENKSNRNELIKMARRDYVGVKLNIPPDKYPKEREYGIGEYEASYTFLQEIRLAMGDKVFEAFVKDLYSKYRNKAVTTKDILKEIRKVDNSKKINEIISFYFK